MNVHGGCWVAQQKASMSNNADAIMHEQHEESQSTESARRFVQLAGNTMSSAAS